MTATQTHPDHTAKADVSQKEHVLIEFRHGLGDAVQLTAVLRHLRHYHPNWQLTVASLVGKHSAFFGQCDEVLILNRDRINQARFHQIWDLEWLECPTSYPHSPSSKAERCLIEVFGLQPVCELCHYRLQPRAAAFEKARRYLRQVCKVAPDGETRFPAVPIHYQGNTSAEYKDLPHEIIRRLCDEIVESGCVPIILDWDRRSPLPDGERIHNPHSDLDLWGGTGTGDAEVLAALIELSQLMIGVDSGPLHVAGGVSTPTIGIWTGHHPLHYFGLADHVTHLVPTRHEDLLRGDRDVGRKFFQERYRYLEYDDLEIVLAATVRERLQDAEGGLIYTRNFWLRTNNSEQDLVVVKDIAEDDAYRIDAIPMHEPVVVDVGAHIGCFSKRFHQRNPLARIFAVECCPENIPALRQNVGSFATVIQAAVTYERDIAMLNAVFPNCVTTGGSRIVSRRDLERLLQTEDVADSQTAAAGRQYWADRRPLMTLTLEQLLEQHKIARIHVLKLDCEGSEFSILQHSTSLDRIDLIIGEYHGRERFHQLVAQRFRSWSLRILKEGELGTFWLANPRREPAEAFARRLSMLPARNADAEPHAAPSTSPQIYLCTPAHTGTHFLRVMLELHPEVSFWKCGRTRVYGRTLDAWHQQHRQGHITRSELIELGVACHPDLPEWTRQEVSALGLSMPEKRVRRHLVHQHAGPETFWDATVPTVVSVRDPLLAMISGLRRNGVEGAECILAGVEFVARQPPGECFYFCVDQWQTHRERALDLLRYLELEPTQQIYDYLALWPSPNAAEAHQHLIRDHSPELVEARRMALEEGRVHPVVTKWANRLREAGLQPFYERLGYTSLAWFE